MKKQSKHPKSNRVIVFAELPPERYCKGKAMMYGAIRTYRHPQIVEFCERDRRAPEQSDRPVKFFVFPRSCLKLQVKGRATYYGLVVLSPTQRAQYPLIKERTLNPNIT